MTLIIAGYNFRQKIDQEKIYRKSHNDSNPSPTNDPFNCKMEVNGLFIAADSAITMTSGKTLLNGFQKVYKLEAKVWEPYFLGDPEYGYYFKDYYLVLKRLPFYLSFAGSTLTAQHILNYINDYLGEIKLSYSHDRKNDIQYVLVLPEEENLLTSHSLACWDENIFKNRSFEHLLTGHFISRAIETSINKALASASQYKLDQESFNAMHTDFLLGLWCPVKNKHELYVYRMRDRCNADFGVTAFTVVEKVSENQIIVLGERKSYEKEAQQIFDNALKNAVPPASSIYDFLNQSIEKTKQEHKKIAKPTYLNLISEYKREIKKTC